MFICPYSTSDNLICYHSYITHIHESQPNIHQCKRIRKAKRNLYPSTFILNYHIEYLLHRKQCRTIVEITPHPWEERQYVKLICVRVRSVINLANHARFGNLIWLASPALVPVGLPTQVLRTEFTLIVFTFVVPSQVYAVTLMFMFIQHCFHPMRRVTQWSRF